MRVFLLLGVTTLLLNALAEAAPPDPAPSSATVVATVNGDTITLAEVDAQLGANRSPFPLTTAQRRQLRAAMLDDLIDDRLIKQFLAKNAPPADPAEVDAQVKAFAAQLARDNQTLTAYLKQVGLSEAQLRADWAAGIQLTAYIQARTKDEQLRAYFAANRDQFERAQVRVSHLVIRTVRGALPGELATAREKVQSIRAEILSGKIDFGTAARKYSHDPSGRNGGDLGYIQWRGPELEEQLSKAAFALKPGALSDVLQTPTGVHLILVTDRKPGTTIAFDKCVLEVFEAYADDFRKDLSMRLRREGHVRISLP